MIRSLGQAASDPGSDRGARGTAEPSSGARLNSRARFRAWVGESAVVVSDGVGVDAGVTVGVDVDVDVVEVRDGVK